LHCPTFMVRKTRFVGKSLLSLPISVHPCASVAKLFSSLDPNVITEAARRSLDLSDFKLADWTATPLVHEKVIETTGGLFRFDGQGWDGAELRAWSVVLKVIKRPGNEGEEPQGLGYWRRELLAYQSGMLADLPHLAGGSGVRAPRCYGVNEHANGAWIWLENIVEPVSPTWTLDHFQQAARHLGCFAGAYLLGKPLPNYPWLCASLFRSLYADEGWWARFTNPASPNHAWQRPVVQAVYGERSLRQGVLQIWAEKEQWLAANESLPQVFCHNDAHRRNLMLCNSGSGQPELAAIDWGFCGPGGLGNDLGELVGTSLSYFAIHPAHAAELERAALAGYLAGLREAGWTGNERLARLGYLIALALYWGGTLPCEVASVQPGESKVDVELKYGRPVEELLPGWTQLAEFTLQRAEEARYLVKQVIL
jgi:hypothetical protein